MRPPMREQEQIVARVRAGFAETEHLQRHAESQLQAVKTMPAALLRQAFTGSL